jgi:hypothetical protein
MLNISPEDQAKLDECIKETAQILRKYTDSKKLDSFESIEVEVRNQMLEVVSPRIGEFFFRQGENKSREKKGQ